MNRSSRKVTHKNGTNTNRLKSPRISTHRSATLQSISKSPYTSQSSPHISRVQQFTRTFTTETPSRFSSGSSSHSSIKRRSLVSEPQSTSSVLKHSSSWDASSRQQHRAMSTVPSIPKQQIGRKLYDGDLPGTLEFYHFSNRKHKCPDHLLDQSKPFSKVIHHPVGRLLISQWIGNFVALNIRDTLQSPNLQYRTKTNSFLIGYDMNNEFVKDVHGVPTEHYKMQNEHIELPSPTYDEHGNPMQGDAIREQLTAFSHTKRLSNVDWENTALIDYGYINFDPNVLSYQQKYAIWRQQMDTYERWLELCNVNPKQQHMINKHMQTATTTPIIHDQYVNIDPIDNPSSDSSQHQNASAHTAQQPPPPLTTKAKVHRFKESAKRLKDPTLRVLSKSFTSTRALVKLVHWSFAPGGFEKALKEPDVQQLLTPPTPQQVLTSLQRVTAKTGDISVKIASAVAHQLVALFELSKPIINRNVLRYAKSHPDSVIKLSSPVLSAVQSTNTSAHMAARWVDEWIGTRLAYHPALRQLNDFATFDQLSDVAPVVGIEPEAPKPSPVADKGVTEVDLFAKVSPTQYTMEDLLKVSDIDLHRLLLSHIHQQRPHIQLSVGLVPYSYDVSDDMFAPYIQDGVVVHPRRTTIPELLLFTTTHDDIHKQAGLREFPDVWLSRKVLNKISAPDLEQLGHLIQQVDPSFKPPKAKKQSTSLTKSIFTKILLPIFAGITLATLLRMQYDLPQLFEMHPDVDKLTVTKVYLKNYFTSTFSFLGGQNSSQQPEVSTFMKTSDSSSDL